MDMGYNAVLERFAVIAGWRGFLDFRILKKRRGLLQ